MSSFTEELLISSFLDVFFKKASKCGLICQSSNWVTLLPHVFPVHPSAREVSAKWSKNLNDKMQGFELLSSRWFLSALLFTAHDWWATETVLCRSSIQCEKHKAAEKLSISLMWYVTPPTTGVEPYGYQYGRWHTVDIKQIGKQPHFLWSINVSTWTVNKSTSYTNLFNFPRPFGLRISQNPCLVLLHPQSNAGRHFGLPEDKPSPSFYSKSFHPFPWLETPPLRTSEPFLNTGHKKSLSVGVHKHCPTSLSRTHTFIRLSVRGKRPHFTQCS